MKVGRKGVAMSKTSVRLVSIVFCTAMTLGGLPGFSHAAESQHPPRVDHILLNVSDMGASITFYRDIIGLRVKSLGSGFSVLEAGNLGIYLSTSRRSWEPGQGKDVHLGLGMYPHFEIDDVKGLVDRLKKAGYKIIQETQTHNWGTEAFVADPDGYTWALFSWRKEH